ncbi:MAG: response regulator transcription factor, partial [Desulfuromonadales bacterium]|nr:response regulator transcription factor [Desulfuromonadales bacterium]
MKILITATDSLSRSLLLKILENNGHEVVEATNKEEILSELRKVAPPELAIIDCTIAGQVDLLGSEIRDLSSPFPCHFLVLLTEDHKTEILTKFQNGIDDYLVKPFGAE